MPDTPVSRIYGGVAADDRRAQRRERLLQAAVEVYGQVGYRNASVKAVCAAAGLTERYFYEAFENSEVLLMEAYETIVSQLLAWLRESMATAAPDGDAMLRKGLTAYFEALRDHPQSARLFLVELSGVSPRVDELVARLSHEMLGTLLPQRKRRTSEGLALDAVGGALRAIATGWIRSGHERSVKSMVDLSLPFFKAMSAG